MSETLTTALPQPAQGATASDRRPGAFRAYGALWARVPREIAYLIAAFPLAVAAFSLVWWMIPTGLGTLVLLFFGVLLFIGALYVARAAGTVDIVMLEWAGRPSIPRPEWRRPTSRSGIAGYLIGLFGNPHYWVYLVYVAFVQFPLSVITFTLTVVWLSIALGGLGWISWGPWVSRFDDGPNTGLARALDRLLQTDAGRVWEGVVYAMLGLLFAFTLPWVVRGMVILHGLVARGMLGRWSGERLTARLAATEDARSAAVAAEGSAMRRIERDIHDGPQQRLIRLQMDLATAERTLDSDSDTARTMLVEARRQAQDALDELRALSRGLLPPILQDRGLVAALESATLRSPVPARLSGGLPADRRLPADVERTAYFVATEALANAAKHAGAHSIVVRVALEGGVVVVAVTDDGNGGARELVGHGLAGLGERLRGVGGTLDVVSPDGGPTTVSARIPLDGHPSVDA